jgi:hypothetical protein
MVAYSVDETVASLVVEKAFAMVAWWVGKKDQ